MINPSLIRSDLKCILIMAMSFLPISFLFQDNGHINFRFVVLRVHIQNLLVQFLSLLSLSLLLVDNCKVEHCGGVLLLSDGYLKVVYCFYSIFWLARWLITVVQDANIEISLKVLRINL